ncbi:MAG TPA: glycosyltransferase family 9 protein [Candidatus Eisenbacteria bacterium]|nr:glycosyltransferase family 9 protein [Candidatus Eisenbacteria bacterium]
MPDPGEILIVKLGALGDVLRTTPLLTALKRRWPAARITWVVDPRHRGVLRGNALIDELLDYSPATLEALGRRRFDLAINLDKDDEALETMSRAVAARRMGFGLDAAGKLCALDSLSDYAYRLGIDDELKFRLNKKSYQEISFEQAGFRFEGEEYLFAVDGPTREAARAHLKQAGFRRGSGPVVGLNTGSGTRFAGKRLPEATWAELAERFICEAGATALLLGGQDEIERNGRIAAASAARGLAVVNTGSHPIDRFAGIVGECDLVVSGDTTAMHIAIALKVPVVAYFASTCSAEIELYGRGRKVVSSISCAPCYKKICPIDEQCMKDMTAAELFAAARDVLGAAAR